jgi:hypothetical protein
VTITGASNGIPSPGTPVTVTFTASRVASITAKPVRSKPLFGYANSLAGVADGTDTGGSGGLGPGTITLIDNTARY